LDDHLFTSQKCIIIIIIQYFKNLKKKTPLTYTPFFDSSSHLEFKSMEGKLEVVGCTQPFPAILSERIKGPTTNMWRKALKA
jgi:hypothetical protein